MGSTEDEQLEREEEVGERRSGRLLRCSGDGFWEWPDLSRGAIWWSAELFRMLGYADGEFEPTLDRMVAMVHPEDAERAPLGSWSLGLVHEESFQSEFRMRCKSGAYLRIECRGRVFRGGDGKPRCVSGAVRAISPKREARGGLLQSEAFFRSAFDGSATGMVVSDLAGRFARVNDAACRMFGYTRDELLGMSFADVTLPEDLEASSEKFEVLARGDCDGFSLEKRYRRKDGSPLWGVITVSLMRDADGEPSCAIAQFQDVGERKQMERELTVSEHRFALLAESIQDVFWMGVPGAKENLYISPGYERVWGRPRSELRENPRAFADAIHPDDKEAFEAVLAKSSSELLPYECEYRIIRPSGEVRWILERAFAVPEGVGGSAVMAGVCTDITERKNAEQALQESEETFRSLFDQSPIAIQLYDAAGVLIDVNPRTLELFGVDDKAHLLGYVMWDSPDHTPETIARVKSGRSVQISAELDFAAVKQSKLFPTTKSGVLQLDLYIFPLTVHGVITGYTVQLVDVTERREVEEQLRQAQKMQAVGRLAGGIAHDLNNILMPIGGYAELVMMRMDEEDPSYADLSRVREAASRAAGLTRQILAFSRKQVLQKRVLSLNGVIASFEDMLRRLIGESVRLTVLPAEGLLPVEVDPRQIEQVLLNLAINSRDAMPEGGHLTIETANVYLDEQYAGASGDQLSPGHYVLMAVSDTGHGMDAETREQVFEPFFTTKEQGGGSGLGLSTTFGIVKQHGGGIRVYSEPGRGALFKVYLPRVEGVASTDEPAALDLSSLRGTETILLVEDEELVRRMVSQTLAAFGYDVIETHEPDEALRIASAREGSIDLLLTDVVMPGMNGTELYRRMAASNPGIKVLYMSGYTDDAIVHHGVLGEGVPFLQKPFGIRRLGQSVRRAVSRAST